jgi:hypothetical protein
MINANEARNKTVANKVADENKRMASLRNWVEETCGSAVEEAVEARKFEVSVEVPRIHDASDVATELREMGYNVHVKWGNPHNVVLINWQKN